MEARKRGAGDRYKTILPQSMRSRSLRLGWHPCRIRIKLGPSAPEPFPDARSAFAPCK
jgi:hypothetical protein